MVVVVTVVVVVVVAVTIALAGSLREYATIAYTMAAVITAMGANEKVICSPLGRDALSSFL